ncbi:taspase, threonine aspartase, 1, partial [Dispira simplex]
MPPFVIAVHAGAGFHSVANENSYRRICQRACEEARSVLEADGDCTQAVVKAIKILEDSEFTNAGYGSNLNIHGAVECDASVMEGSTGSFGAIGAVSRIKNPIDAAYALQQQERRRVFPSGRIPPLFLVGSGAETWASTQGVSLLTSSQSLITPCAQAKYQHYHQFAQAMDPNDEDTVDTGRNPSSTVSFDELNDTVGAICQDYQGNTAAGVSSGGVLLKFPGRIGEAAMFGAGCWAEQGNRENNSTSSACSVTGTGEQIIRTMFAKNCVDIMASGEDPNQALHDLLTTQFT